MPIKSADWIYSEDENGDVDTSTIDLISPEGGSAGMVRAEVDPVCTKINP